MLIAWCAAAWAPSTRTGTPLSLALATICRIGLMVPSALDTCVSETNLVRSLKRSS